MQQETEYKIVKKEGKITVMRDFTQTFDDVKESSTNLQKLRAEISQLTQQVAQNRKMLDGALQKQVEEQEAMLTKLRKFEKEWTEANRDGEEKLRKELKQELKKLKAEKGWARASKEDKPKLRHEIFMQACKKADIEMSHPLVQSLFGMFDEA